MAELRAIKSSVAVIRSHLRWFVEAAGLVDRPDRQDALLHRFEKLPEYFETVSDSYLRYMEAVEEVSLELYPQASRDRVESDFSQVHELSDQIIQRSREILRVREGSTTPPEAKHTPSAILGRLPSLELPRFEGRLENWVGFQNLFHSLVDARQDLSPSQRLAYLLSALEGEARGIVQHLPITDDNYKIALDLLQSRYQNLRRLADTHVGQILGLRAVTRLSSLRSDLLNPLLVAYNALRSLSLPVEQWSFLLLHIVLSKLPTDLKARFEQKYGGDSATYLPPFDDLIKFLQDECRMMDNSGVVVEAAQPPPRRAKETAHAWKATPQRSAPPRFAATQSTVVCAYCREDHHIINCRSFSALHVASRRRIADKRRLCFSCLGGHFQRDCDRPKPCAHCRGDHLALLCANANRQVVQSEPSMGRQVESGNRDRAPPVDFREAPRKLGRRSPPPSTDTSRREVHTSPPRQHCAATDRQPAPRSNRMPSPPLAERPRLEEHPPRYGRVGRYYPPETALMMGHRRPYQVWGYPWQQQ